MATKTYIPTVIKILRTLCVYIVRYRPQLEKSLLSGFGAGAVTALNAVVIACDAFLELVSIPEGS